MSGCVTSHCPWSYFSLSAGSEKESIEVNVRPAVDLGSEFKVICYSFYTWKSVQGSWDNISHDKNSFWRELDKHNSPQVGGKNGLWIKLC